MKFINQNHMFVKNEMMDGGWGGGYHGHDDDAIEEKKEEAKEKRFKELEDKVASLEKQNKNKITSEEVIF